MFTGLVQTVGSLGEIALRRDGAGLRVAADLDELTVGESVSVDGMCLTVSEVLAQGFRADASAETLAVTTVAGWRRGRRVNLERACRLSDRLGGHLVLGHVDAVAAVRGVERAGASRRLELEAPQTVRRYLAPKGSVAIDGVSLTINRLLGSERFQVMVVPHTLEVTTLDALRPGDVVNVEADVMARYAARLLEHAGILQPHRPAAGEGDGTLMSLLRAGGYAD